ncbi:MAG: hypothetical protein HQ541_08480, partial [Mariniphaga sp.]|nr:hypothetical protein [Mariniphaga sp.]
MKLVSSKRQRFERRVDRLGTGSGIGFMYVGKPKTFFTATGKMLRFNGYENLDRVKGKMKTRGKVLLKHRATGELVRVSFRDLEVMT